MHAICAAALLLMAVPAHAITPVWSITASSCVPDAESIRLDRYTTAGPTVAHRDANVDLIQLMCNISDPPFQGGDWDLVITYRDSTGTGTGARLIGRLLRVSRLTGVQNAVVTFNSNNTAATTMVKGSIGFTHTFDFDTYYYYVLLQLDRTTAAEIVQVVGVAIEPIIP
jgi:hypothetical protein